jgi:uncharacterized membrane protein HdeD (DUF308 family)
MMFIQNYNTQWKKYSIYYKLSCFLYFLPGLYILFNKKLVYKIIPHIYWELWGLLLLLNGFTSYFNDVKHKWKKIDWIVSIINTLLCIYYAIYVKSSDLFILSVGLIVAFFCKMKAVQNYNLFNKKEYELYHSLWHLSIPFFGVLSLMFLKRKYNM